MLPRRSILVYGALVSGAWSASVGIAQDGPIAAGAHPVGSGVAGAAAGRTDKRSPLERPVTLTLIRSRLDSAVDRLAAAAGVAIVYTDRVLPVDRIVSDTLTAVPLGRALARVLQGTAVRVQTLKNGRLLLVKSQAVKPASAGSIAGRVIAKETGAPIIGATVTVNVQDSTHRAVSGDSGKYVLTDIPAGTYTVGARYIGFMPQTKKVVVADAPVSVDFSLEPRATSLDELVTTATGRQRRLDVANDITVIKADSVMKTAPIRNVTDLLATRVPGLTSQRTSGAPGDPTRIRLRGSGSPLRGNDPIVIVDGIRIYAEQSADRSANLANKNSNYAAPSPIDYIDPNSIETIEVLKGPSAATLYGQDAANGVIVITTKRGKAGPTRWTAAVEHGQTAISGDFPDLYLRWGHLQHQSGAVLCPVGNVSYGGLTGSIPIRCLADSTNQFQLLNDPSLTVIGKGRRNALTLGASGGTSSLTYALTGSFQDELGLPQLPPYEAARYLDRLGTAVPDWMQRPQDYKTFGLSSNLTARLGPKADVTLSSTFTRGRQQRSSLEQQLGLLMTTYIDKASGTYYTYDENFGTLSEPGSVSSGFLSGYYQRAADIATAFTNSLTLSWRPLSWLTTSADGGLNIIHRNDETFIPWGAIDTVGALNVGQGTSVQSTVNLRGTALAPLGRGFQFRFSAGANYAGTSIGDQTLSTTNLAAGTSLQGSVITGGGRTAQDDATFGWYVEPSVGNSKFNFSSGLRLDGGTSYGGNVSGFSLPKFPKMGFSYLVSDEPWFPMKSLFQSLRVRIAYGRASRQPGVADRLRTYSTSTPIFADGGVVNGSYILTLGNTNLRPERSSEMEGGFDADAWDSRITMGLSIYRKTTDDALLPRPVPVSVYNDGAGQAVNIMTNIGRIQNTGINFSLGAQILRSGPVTWSTDVQLSQNRNFVVKLGPGVNPFYATNDSYSLSNGGTRVAPGYPLFGRWARPIIGYADGNDDGTLQPDEIVLGDTAVFVGALEPNYTAGLHTTLSFWHGSVTLNAGFFYEDGLTQINTVARMFAPFSRSVNDTTATLAEQVASARVNTNYNWIQTVSTFRFNDLALTYQMPASLARRLGAQNLSVAIQGGNLALWTNYRGIDPNVNSRVTGNDVVDSGVLPVPRTWQFRINATY